MANLIITVISIALFAVAAIMGAYYGGTAFMDGQAKARSNKIINVMTQTELAYNLCIAQEPNGRSNESACNGNDGGGGTMVSKGYLSADPIEQICNNGSFYCDETGYGFGTPIGDGFFDVTFYGGYPTSEASKMKNAIELCKLVAKNSRGENALPLLYDNPNAFDQKMDCAYGDNDGDGVLSENDFITVYDRF